MFPYSISEKIYIIEVGSAGMAPTKKGKKGEGFHSAAGLIRYFDAEEETALKIDPRVVVVAGIISIVVIELLKWLIPVV